MKNLLIYINPAKKFNEENEILARVQIDNSLDLGWSRKDILLVTNFPYEYNNVRSLVVGDENFCQVQPKSTKTITLIDLIKKGIINQGLYWVHDFDAYQLVKIAKDEIKMDKIDMALTDYGRMPRWTTGSIFFKKEALDILQHMKDIIYEHKIDEENALMSITRNNLRWTMVPGFRVSSHEPIPVGIKGLKKINQRIKKINVSYNFTWMNLPSCYRLALKPIRVAHFHPLQPIRYYRIKKPFDFFKGQNKIRTQLIPDRIIEIFNYHGIK